MNQNLGDMDHQALMKKALVELREMRAKLKQLEGDRQEPIAIIGMGCRFPQAENLESFWQLLEGGGDAITEVPSQRWQLDAYYDSDPSAPGKTYTRHGGFVKAIDEFDPQFFGIAPREALSLDPQQRLVLEVSWEAVENAGLAAPELKDSLTGVFIGIASNDYSHKLFQREITEIDAYVGTGNAHSAASGRISYLLGLKGPCLSVDTACSSSLVAVHLACQSLRGRESDLALAGGVNAILCPEVTLNFSKARMLSAEGCCKTFDAVADGYVRGEGCGIVILKRLRDALRDEDNILAVIRGSAINQDGPSSGLTVPNGPSQQAVIRKALEDAGSRPSEIDYVEAHGTGTSLGDPIEVGALGAVFGKEHSREQPLLIGSVKTNIGHLEAAAGIAGLIKVVLSLQQERIPPHLHFHQPNPHINWNELPLIVAAEGCPWFRGERKRLAGLSSFGFSGTNAHLVLAEAPIQSKRETPYEHPLHLLTLSAKTPKALEELASRYQHHLEAHPELAIADICFTANTGRSHFNHRLAAIASDRQELATQLGQVTAGEEVPGLFLGQISSSTSTPKVAFLFTGQGSQYVSMGRQLYETQPVFRQALDQCNQILRSYLEEPLLSVLYPQDAGEGNSSLLDQTSYTQPALFALEYALYEVWKSWGVEPKVVMGHSVGEYVAACVAGVFSLEDGLRLIAYRGKLMQQLPHNGKMGSVLADEATVRKAIAPYEGEVAIAAFNGPKSLVISGQKDKVEAVKTALEEQGVKTKELNVSHAFHSPLMEPMLAEFEQVAQTLNYSPPKIQIISNVTGEEATAEIATPQYWVNHIRQPVRFAQSMETLGKGKAQVFIEIGPKPILLGMGRMCLPQEERLWLPSLRPTTKQVPEFIGLNNPKSKIQNPKSDDWQQMLHSLGELYVQGVAVDWLGFDRDYARSKVVLPTYPFQRQRYWLETNGYHHKKQLFSTSKTLHPLLGQKLDLESLLAGLGEQHRFESQIAASSPAYLGEHRVFDKALLPAAAYLEIVLAAGLNVFNSPLLVVEDVGLQQGLILPEDESKTVQTILTPLENRAYKFQIFTQEQENGQGEPKWILHTEGKIRASETATIPPAIDLEKYLTECEQPLEITKYYQKYKERGIDYGVSFQRIQQLWRGSKQAVGKIQLPPELGEQATDYQWHPALLDAAFQVIGAAIEETDSDQTYLPVGIRKLQVYGRPSNEVWAMVSITEKPLESNITVVDEQGTLVAQIEGLRLRATTAQTLFRTLPANISDWFYEIDWQAHPLESTDEPISATQMGSWLLFIPSTEIGQQLSQALEDRSQQSILVSPGLEYKQLDSHHYQLNPTDGQQFTRLLQESSKIKGIVHLWSMRATKESISLEELQTAQELGCASVLHLLQGITKTQPEELPPLWLVTKGTQSVQEEAEVVEPQQAPLWGLARVIALEHPGLPCRRVDLDPSSNFSEALPSLVSELFSPNSEDQLAYRQGLRYVPRLVRQKQHQAREGGQLQIPVEEPFQLKLSAYGLLDNLHWQPMQRRSPEPDEVEIEVKAVGLNFRDVLNALGLLKDYYERELAITSAGQLTFGFECAGIITSLGKEVTQWQVGDEVMAALIHNGFSSYVTTPAELVMAKPKQMSFSEAATLPLTFLTAYYGLHHLAQIKAGERVLIHAAAGGVGQAAVQIARQAGAEVLATASPPKWEFLKSLGIQYVMNSRTLEFAEEIMNLSQGEGVDIVFNSLNGEFIDKSFEVLAQGGRFVEIGKIGIWSLEQVQRKRPNVSYFPFDLGQVAQENRGLITKITRELEQHWEQGNLKPLPHQVFPVQKVIEAFRYMQQAKQIGKVVVSMADQSEHRETEVAIQPEASYLITGGLGALGLEVAQWMVGEGARHLVLTGRREPSAPAREKIEELEKAGAEVSVLQGDISQQQDAAQLLERIDASGTPLKGVIHGAGVLDDGVLQQMSWERFTKVMAPKVEGAWHLHQLTKHLPLDFFICFSSMASLLGSPGQGNYAAANAFMDALAHYRQGMGLPGLSINWGPWSQGGMAARLANEHQSRMQAKGISPIAPEQGMQALAELLSAKAAQVAVLPVDWSQFWRQLPRGIKMPFLEIFSSSESSNRAEFLQELRRTPLSDRHTMLVSYLRKQVAKVLGLRDSQIEVEKSLTELGLDSLMAVEMRNRIISQLNIEVPVANFIEGYNITKLAQLLFEELVLTDLKESASENVEAHVQDEMEEIVL
jgi:myxalamid-type polyketide synthase MxaB